MSHASLEIDSPIVTPLLTDWPHPIKGVVFDMDGLLLDTERLYKQVMLEICAEWGLHMSEEIFISLVGIPGDKSADIYYRHYGRDFDVARFNTLCFERISALCEVVVPLKVGAKLLVEQLSERQVPIAVATSTGRDMAHGFLERAGLKQHFDQIVTRHDVTHGKPNPEPFLTAAKRLGLAPEQCIAFEDSHNGVRAAHSAGMATIMVPDILLPIDEIAQRCAAIMPSLLHFKTELDHFFVPMAQK
ncbi:HAD family hydrolase [Maritalea mediterranea]|uniref:HAD family phosphatase n=1 Tax=Maritalea mediterranea TaxID=2909667 RepID=A0ABS9E3I6_9HYPH|nr:HAD family phosphatase [Maritalea mediterranea]MCF4097421.1 HAD family phosphatase [Maritalea mediterranea]